ncbi:uncharacterized protein LOC124205687 [Daphnia pulex]|uniref:uncharacterized protein LOC124205687 n=1 Tax=Daphnia pulex TaxID=6669 RepID=UPI001EDEA93D|nr:uncharacterized protein LOC124205687 [Daphnia pulex]
MKSVFIFLVATIAVAISHQQFHRMSPPRPTRGLVWLTPYSPYNKPVLANYQPIFDNQHQDEIHEIPSKITPHSFRRKNRPSVSVTYLPLNEDLTFTAEEDDIQNNSEEDDGEYLDEYSDIQSRIKWFKGFNKNNGGRFIYSSTINNPFYKTATFTVTSTVTTLGSVILCVPANNLAAVPAPACAGRKKREIEDSADINQFPIAPSETLKVIPTILPVSADALQPTRESRVMSLASHTIKRNNKPNDLLKLVSSLEEVIQTSEPAIPSKESQQQPLAPREERLFGGGYAASTTLTSYSFIGATVTSTVLLDPTGMNVAVCLPSGYVVC